MSNPDTSFDILKSLELNEEEKDKYERYVRDVINDLLEDGKIDRDNANEVKILMANGKYDKAMVLLKKFTKITHPPFITLHLNQIVRKSNEEASKIAKEEKAAKDALKPKDPNAKPKGRPRKIKPEPSEPVVKKPRGRPNLGLTPVKKVLDPKMQAMVDKMLVTRVNKKILAEASKQMRKERKEKEREKYHEDIARGYEIIHKRPLLIPDENIKRMYAPEFREIAKLQNLKKIEDWNTTNLHDAMDMMDKAQSKEDIAAALQKYDVVNKYHNEKMDNIFKQDPKAKAAGDVLRLNETFKNTQKDAKQTLEKIGQSSADASKLFYRFEHPEVVADILKTSKKSKKSKSESEKILEQTDKNTTHINALFTKLSTQENKKKLIKIQSHLESIRKLLDSL
jgi:hypothetical protein